MTKTLTPVLAGWLVMMIGIWHPYVVNTPPEIAAAVGTVLGAGGMGVALFG